MHAYLHCLSHTPLVGFVDPEQAVLDEVNGVIADARRRIAEFNPELVVLFAPDHYNGFFYDVMPPFCLGVGATAIGDFASAAGDLPVPTELAEACAHAVINSGIDLAVSYNMQVDHGFAQPLEFLLGGLDRVPVLPVFINGVAAPLPGFQRTRLLGEAMGRFLNTLNKRVLILGSGGLSHQPPVPELAKADAHLRDRLLGGGKQLPPDERERRQQRVINTGGQSVLYALAPLFYPAAIRATGVGTAVAVGRLGAMSGPLLAGKMLALGAGTVGVMAASAPGIVLAGVAVFWLMHRQQRAAMV
ncbi:3-carboxyethylcatechol 2,3-dioxygenase [Klebsiella pneumoniae]|uniref:3-carboxyethylcatechol 2,3-dioxygenase n=1 Tax=Klebsiella pneumoniae TaxID=573 RepID=UPI00148F1576|nr:3-carboxyethylcatechol 2,3-dioxygenase [Klebsiella pneumoniae]NON03596.1 3-carboxyethylcatechol 2,3-dioxygenase [Klebsiella pneumoniae]